MEIKQAANQREYHPHAPFKFKNNNCASTKTQIQRELYAVLNVFCFKLFTQEKKLRFQKQKNYINSMKFQIKLLSGIKKLHGIKM